MDQALFKKIEQAKEMIHRKLGLPECLYNNIYIELHDILACDDLGWNVDIDEAALNAKCDKVLAEYVVLEDNLDYVSSQQAIETVMESPELKQAYQENPLLVFQVKEDIKHHLEQQKKQSKQGATIISLDSRRNRKK